MNSFTAGNQWSDESQFESYRKLCYHIVRGLSALTFKTPEALMSALSRPTARRGVPKKVKRGVHARPSVPSL